jgi:glutaconate CoA-transferase subunit B
VPKVILFRTEHSRRTLVPKVDFISAPGANDENVYRPGGPIALVTNRCLFSFTEGRFTLASVHPGHTVEEIAENTGFDFDMPSKVTGTPAPSPETLKLLREVIAPQLAEVYPQFAAQVFGVGKAALTG